MLYGRQPVVLIASNAHFTKFVHLVRSHAPVLCCKIAFSIDYIIKQDFRV